jgi:hypothetical protein
MRSYLYYFEKQTKTKRARDVAQEVEPLPTKLKALQFNPQYQN